MVTVMEEGRAADQEDMREVGQEVTQVGAAQIEGFVVGWEVAVLGVCSPDTAEAVEEEGWSVTVTREG